MQKKDTMMNIFGEGTKFKGNMRVAGSLRIDGEFDGQMTVSETLIVGKTGKIKGEIKSKNSIIGGAINGDLKSGEKVELQVGAKFEGDLSCKKLIVEEGVTFDGNCKMSETKSTEKDLQQRNLKAKNKVRQEGRELI
jgi:cytoskeletal protein CcmA (bactofilin family)